MKITREHGRILSVETKYRGDALAEDAASGATTLVVGDAGDFDEDGGWLTVNDQVVEYTEVDDDEGTITLATGLDAAADEGDSVHVWSELYEEPVDYQLAEVELDGEYDNPEPVVAEVAEGVGTLPEGDRGRAGESCTLHRVSDDEWEVVGVGGRGRKSQEIRFEEDDFYVLTAADIAAGSATMPLSHRPIDEALTCALAGIPQPPTEWSIDYDARTLTIPLAGWEQSGDLLWVHYAYRKGIVERPFVTIVPYSTSGWSYKQVADTDSTDRSTEDPSTWATGSTAFGNSGQPGPWTVDTRLWLQRNVPAAESVTVSVKVEDNAEVYVNGNLIGTIPYAGVDASNLDPPTDFSVPLAYTESQWTLAILCIDEEPYPSDIVSVDVEVMGRLL